MRVRACGWLAWFVMTGVAAAQSANFDRNTIFIDPSHGGADGGARLGGQLQEKDITLGVAAKLATLLAARGFNVAMSRSGDFDGGSPDRRAELANRSHAVACLVLHASASTAGVVVGISALGTALMRVNADDKPGAAVPWSRAQETYVAQSGRLANQVGTALTRSGTAVTMMRVVMRPLDNLMCPAISIELGTAAEAGGGISQQSIAESIAGALKLWRTEANAPDETTSQASSLHGATP